MANTKDTVDVPATYLDKANFPGPFTAGVNQIFLTKLWWRWNADPPILKASGQGPVFVRQWNSKNPALLPLEGLQGQYFYEVDLSVIRLVKTVFSNFELTEAKHIQLPSRCMALKDGKPDLTNWLLLVK